MINLLPPELKNNYRYASRNVVLLRWVVILVVVFIGLCGLGTFGLLTIHSSTENYQQQVSTINSKLSADHVSQTETQVSDISSSLRLAVKVLGKEILFSKLITDIGAAMPSGAILTSLNIDETSDGLDLTAATTSYTTATQVQVNLADPNSRLFSQVDIVSIVCAASSSEDSTHPCTAQYRALFNNENQFLFINSGSSK